MAVPLYLANPDSTVESFDVRSIIRHGESSVKSVLVADVERIVMVRTNSIPANFVRTLCVFRGEASILAPSDRLHHRIAKDVGSASVIDPPKR